MPNLDYVLGIDYGEKRVGVAIAHPIARLPRPLTVLTNQDTLLDDITALVAGESVGLVAVGLPRNMDGSYSAQTRQITQFADELRTVLPVPVVLVDETLTSVDAERILAGKAYQKGVVDALAAALILERYFTEHANQGATA